MPPKYLILIPSFNSGPQLTQVLAAAHRQGHPVWVVIDGSTDSSPGLARDFAERHSDVRVLACPRNEGKGAAFLHGAREALKQGFTHALAMDADGQHHAGDVPRFIEASKAHPEAMILGHPIFGPDAPAERVQGRRVGNSLARLNTFGGDIADSLFGFRVYPLHPSVEILSSIRSARRFDFDTEIAVRLYWKGVRPINLATPVTYPPEAAGGVTHFRYLRDNLLLAATHVRLFLGMLLRIPRLIILKRRFRKMDPVSNGTQNKTGIDSAKAERIA